MSTLRTLSLAVLTAFAAQAHAATFVWDGNAPAPSKEISKVQLSNKTVIEQLKGKDLFDQAVTARAPGSKNKLELVRNDFVAIEAAYPNVQKAAAVLISDNCSGNACVSQTVTLVLPRGNEIKKYAVDSPAKITLAVEGDQVVGGFAEGVPAGVDKYGSAITATRPFMPGAGFVAAGFKKEFIKLIGEHPESLFDDKVLREPFAKAVGLETFRDLRQAISVASPTYLVQGRYIVLQGCMPHDCGGNYSFVMIDAVTSTYFWARYNEGRTRYSGSSAKIDKAAIQAVFSDPAFEQNDDARLSVSPVGKIVYKTGGR